MQIEISSSAKSKLEQILGCLYAHYDLEDLMLDELVDALVNLGFDAIVSEDELMIKARDRLVEHCIRKVGVRVANEEQFHEEVDYRG